MPNMISNTTGRTNKVELLVENAVSTGTSIPAKLRNNFTYCAIVAEPNGLCGGAYKSNN